MSEVAAPDRLYRTYDIDRAYDAVDTYDEEGSWFGDGKYPPDWGERRAAVKTRDNHRCLRCDRSLSNVTQAQIDHITPLADGGTNELSNLATLCIRCHAAVHPVVYPIDADWKQAPVFPASGAPDSLSVVHKGVLVDDEAEATSICAVVDLLDVASGSRSVPWMMDDGHHHDFGPQAARQLPHRMGEYLSQVGLALGEGKQGLVERIKNGAEKKPAEIHNVVVESDTGGMPLSEPSVSGVVTTTLPADDEQATVRATTNDGYIEHSFELGDTPYTLVRLRTSGRYDDMAPPWREPTDDEQPYGSAELPEDPVDVDDADLEHDPDPPVAVALATLGAYGLAATVGSLAWLVFFGLGVLTAYDAAWYVGEHHS